MKYDSRGPILIFKTQNDSFDWQVIEFWHILFSQKWPFENLELLLFAGTFLFNFNFSELFIPSFKSPIIDRGAFWCQVVKNDF